MRRASAAVGVTGAKADTMMASAAVPTAMETRMEDTWTTRETDTPAGERTAAATATATAAVAAGTAEEKAAAMTAGAIPSSGPALQDYTRMPHIFVLLYIFFLKRKKFCKNPRLLAVK